MTEITEYFDRLLWFIYRVIFTVIPSVVFLCIFLAFLIYTDVYTYSKIDSIVKNFGFFHWSIVFSIAFCVNLIFESFTNMIVYRILNFYKIANNKCTNDETLHKILEKNDPTFLSTIKDSHGNIDLGPSVFNFGLLKSNSKSIWFNNYVWFLISREFLFCNTSFVILLSSILFMPYFIYELNDLNLWQYVLLQLSQVAFSIFVIYGSKKIIDSNYRIKDNNESINDYTTKNAKINVKYFIVPGILFVLGMLSLLINLQSWALILLIDTTLILIIPLLFFRAMREFLHVEYLILISHTKQNENSTPES